MPHTCRFWGFILFYLFFSLPKGLVLISTWNVLAKSLWTSTLCSVMLPKWWQQGLPSPKNNVLISGCWRQATGVLKLHLTPACQASQAVIFLASSLSWELPDCPLEAFTIDSCFLSVMLFLGGSGACTGGSNEGNVQSSFKDVCEAGRKRQGCLNDLFNLPFLLVYLLRAPFPWEVCSDMLVFGVVRLVFYRALVSGWEQDSTFSLRHQDRRKKKKEKYFRNVTNGSIIW